MNSQISAEFVDDIKMKIQQLKNQKSNNEINYQSQNLNFEINKDTLKKFKKSETMNNESLNTADKLNSFMKEFNINTKNTPENGTVEQKQKENSLVDNKKETSKINTNINNNINSINSSNKIVEPNNGIKRNVINQPPLEEESKTKFDDLLSKGTKNDFNEKENISKVVEDTNDRNINEKQENKLKDKIQSFTKNFEKEEFTQPKENNNRLDYDSKFNNSNNTQQEDNKKSLLNNNNNNTFNLNKNNSNNNTNTTPISSVSSTAQNKKPKPNTSEEMLAYLSNRTYNKRNEIDDFANFQIKQDKLTEKVNENDYFSNKSNTNTTIKSSKNTNQLESNKFKIDDIKNLSKQLLFLTDDKLKNLGEEYCYELGNLANVINKIFKR